MLHHKFCKLKEIRKMLPVLLGLIELKKKRFHRNIYKLQINVLYIRLTAFYFKMAFPPRRGGGGEGVLGLILAGYVRYVNNYFFNVKNPSINLPEFSYAQNPENVQAPL